MKQQSASDHIRAELKADRTQTAKEILSKLAAKGITVTAHNVYQVRSQQRAKRRLAVQTRRENGKTLTACMIEILYNHPEGLTDKELVNALKKVYRTKAKDFLLTVRKRLYALVHHGRIIKHNPSNKYVLTDKERGKAPKTATTAASQVLSAIALDQNLLYKVKKLVDGFGEAVNEVLALEIECATKGGSLVQYVETVKKLGE